MINEKELETRVAVETADAPADRPKKNVNKGLIVIIFLLLLALAFSLWYFNRGDRRYEADSRAVAGYIKSRTPEEIEALLNQIVEEGMLNVSMNGHITVKKNREADVCIENIPTNYYLVRVDIMIEDSDGQNITVYESGTIAPGYCIEYGKFKVLPPEGVVDAVAVFTALDKETLEKVGQVRLNIVVEREAS